MPKLRSIVVLLGVLMFGTGAHADSATGAWDPRFVSYTSPTTPGDVVEWRGNLVVASGFYSDLVNMSRVLWIWDGHTWSELEGPFDEVDEDGIQLGAAAYWDMDVHREELDELDELVVAATRDNWSHLGHDTPPYFFSVGTWDGSRWKRLGGDLPGDVRDVAVIQDNFYVNGRFLVGPDEFESRVLRWNGQSWENLVGAGTAIERELHVVGTDLLISGTLHTRDGRTVSGLSAWDGSDWRQVAPSPGTIRAVTRWQGDLVVGTRAREQGQAVLHRWTGQAWEPVGGGLPRRGSDGVFSRSRSVTDLRVEGNTLRITGSFELPGDDTIAHVATWDGTTWTRDDEGMEPHGTAVAGFASWRGSTLIYGYFPYVSGRHVDGLARETHDGWSELRRDESLIGFVKNMMVRDDHLWVFGQLLAGSGARMAGPVTWDGSSWNEVLPGNVNGEPIGVVDLHGVTYAIGPFKVRVGEVWGEAPVAVLDGNGLAPLLGFDWPDSETLTDAVVWRDRIVIATRARSDEGSFASRLIFWDGTTLESFDTADRGSIRTLAVYDDRLFVGGRSVGFDGEPPSMLAAYDGYSWSSFGGDTEGTVDALEVVDGALVVGGRFDVVGDAVAARSIARWDGESWSALGTGFTLGATGEFTSSVGVVLDLVVHDGHLVTTGLFDLAGDVTVNGLAKWDGATWQPFAAESSDAEVSIQSGQALASYDGSLYVYGTFLVAGKAEEKRFARWDESSAGGQ